MQPMLRQVPPRYLSFSTMAVFSPSCAARIAATYPPGPEPLLTTSNLSPAIFNRSYKSHATYILSNMPQNFIPPHGGYEDLLSFQKARIVYDGTVRFCERFLERRDRTVDQMVQAARSGKQNILEGSRASGTSKETEIKLTNVARARLEELLEDYREFIRLRGLEEWSREDAHTRRLPQWNP